MKRIYLHPLAVRLWHWLNAACFLVLILTGIQIRYSLLGWLTFKSAVEAHNVVAFVLIANLLFWAIWHVASGKIRLYLPKLGRAWVQAAVRQVRYYAWGMMRGEKNPHHVTPEAKFNTLQQFTYMQIMLVLLPAQCITGVLLWDPLRFGDVIAALGGLKIVAAVHVVLFILLTAFLFGHIYLATLGHGPMEHIKAMFTGYEDEYEEAAEAHPGAGAQPAGSEPAASTGAASAPVPIDAQPATAERPRP